MHTQFSEQQCRVMLHRSVEIDELIVPVGQQRTARLKGKVYRTGPDKGLDVPIEVRRE
jgi:hypothetical protein